MTPEPQQHPQQPSTDRLPGLAPSSGRRPLSLAPRRSLLRPRPSFFASDLRSALISNLQSIFVACFPLSPLLISNPFVHPQYHLQSISKRISNPFFHLQSIFNSISNPFFHLQLRIPSPIHYVCAFSSCFKNLRNHDNNFLFVFIDSKLYCMIEYT